MGEIITFYSYKGGVGRTMAMANVAVLLAKWGYEVLMIDWDLEAPGLEFYFKKYLRIVEDDFMIDLDPESNNVEPDINEYPRVIKDSRNLSEKLGLVDLLMDYLKGGDFSEEEPLWRTYVQHFQLQMEESHATLDFMSAGSRKENGDKYLENVRDLDFASFYKENHGGLFFEKLRNEWKSAYDFILIDSRTGITDISGVCTIQFPDKLVSLFTANELSMRGVIEVSEKARKGRYKLPFDRKALITIPVPSRFENTEYELSRKWLNRFAKELQPLYANWLSEEVDPFQIIEQTKVPYIPFFNFGERLPVIEQGTSDPVSISYAYETLAAMLANQLDNIPELLELRSNFVQKANRADQPQFFFSYSREDEVYARRIIKELEKAGMRVVDYNKTRSVRERDKSVFEAIERAVGMIVLLSQSSINSEFLNKELAYALDQNISVIPVMISDVGENIPQDLKNYQPIDFTRTDFETGMKRLISSTAVHVATGRGKRKKSGEPQRHSGSMITKTDLLTYLNAPMHLWAAKHNQLEADTLSRYDRYLMTQGVEIEALAKEYLHQKFADARYQVNTERTVGDGAFLARLDGLVYDTETETYDIYEIKSSTSVSKTHQYDLIFQYLVAAAGLTIKNIFLLHVNKEYDQAGELDLAAFFQIENGNDWIAEIGPAVRALREAALQVVELDTPDGIQDCLKPGSCPCPSLCHPRVPEEYSIYALPRLHKTKARALKDDGILAIDDIPDDFKLSDNQRRHATAVQTGQPQIDLPAIQEKLSELKFPLYFLDYETYNPARPMHPGYKPYQHMVFQYSLHVLHSAGGELEHYDFVASNDEDPGAQLAAHLAQYIGTSGSVIVWNQGFEAGRNREMAAMYPEYSEMLLNVNERIYDLMLIFSKHDYVDPDFKGSASIKNVLPVLVKDYAHEYDKLPIPKGDEAMMAWLDLMTGAHAEEDRQTIIKDLLAYCELDTMAMVKIWEVLARLVGG